MSGIWFFDLDNTLHNASHAIFGGMDERINQWIIQHLQVDAAEADRIRREHWRRYGATLIGLVRHHQVDGLQYLEDTHRFDPRPLMRFERGLVRKLAPLPGRKMLLTNAPSIYSRRVMAELDLERRFHGHVAIDHMRVFGQFAPKPSKRMLRQLLARHRIQPHQAVLVEDSVANLKAARAVGMRTVLVCGYTRGAVRSSGYVPAHSAHQSGRASCVDCCVHSVAHLRRKAWLISSLDRTPADV